MSALPNGRSVLLRVSPTHSAILPPLGQWLFVSGEARNGYTERFDAASQVIINHNLGRIPGAISVRTLGGLEVEVACAHLNSNQLLLNFDVPTAGIIEVC